MNTLLLTLLFNSASVTFNLPQGLLESLCYIESTHNINAVHHDDGATDSLGVCQLKLETAKWLGFKGTRQQLMDPSINIYYAAKYLARQDKRYNSLTKAVIAYNMGSVRQHESTVYSKKVFKQWRKYKCRQDQMASSMIKKNQI